MANLNRQCRRYQYFWVIGSIIKYAFIRFVSYWVSVRDGTFFDTTVDKPNGWFHSVLNFFGPDEGLGIYHNGMHVRNIAGKGMDNTSQTPLETLSLAEYGLIPMLAILQLMLMNCFFINRTLTEKEIRMFSQNTA